MKKINSIRSSVRSFFDDHQTQLTNSYPGINVQIILRYLLDEFSNGEDPFNFEQKLITSKHVDFLNYLKSGKPIEYYFGRSYFYDSYFYINESVLIPRQETEILVELVKPHMQKSESFCEIGVGSGAIALSLLKDLKNKRCLLTDICPDALKVCKANAKNISINRHHDLQFLLADRMEGIKKSFDLIVSNPPYIKEKADLAGVHQQVHEYEPHKALYIADNRYDEWFETFFKQVKLCLNNGGVFFMEGHEDHLKDQRDLALSIGFKNASIHKDLSGRDRFLELDSK